jgi:hypothetical protein
MPLPPDYLAAIAGARAPSSGPLVVPWPMPGNLGGQVSFSTFTKWRSFVLALSPRRAIPEVVVRKFERAQKLYVLTWLDFDLIKAGELVAMTALELALTDRYAGAETGRRRKLVAGKAENERRKISKSEKWWTEYVSFADLLKYMVERDGLTEEQIPQTVRKLPEFGVKQREERAVRESERLGLIGRLTRPKRRPGPQCAQIEPRDPPQAATAAVMASTPRMLSARRKL